MDYFQAASLLSPFVAAALTSLLSYNFATKTKRKEYLYQNRVEAFKLIAAKVAAFKIYCEGRIAILRGNEFSPYYDEAGSGLSFRSEIARESELNQIFLTPKSRKVITSLLGNISLMCNAELAASASEEDLYGNVYELAAKECENCLSILYSELDLD